MNLRNQVRAVRRSRHLTQQQLADQAGITRQTVGAVESGSMMPSVLVALQLARVLQCTVEQLFAVDSDESPQWAEPPTREGAVPVRLSRLDRTLWAWPLPAGGPPQAADAIWAPDRPLQRLHEQGPENTLVLLGCHPGLHILEGYLQRRSDPVAAIVRVRNSREAVRGMTARKAHAAGIHLYDPEGNRYNLSAARQALQAEGGFLVHFARWEEGLCFRSDAPVAIRRVADLAQKPVRVIEREVGSEAYNLLRRQLATAGIDPGHLAVNPVVAGSHAQVAQAVRDSLADAGITVRHEAEIRGLAFLPLAEESFDLLIPARLFQTPPAQALLEVLADGRFRQELALSGSDSSRSGTILWSQSG